MTNCVVCKQILFPRILLHDAAVRTKMFILDAIKRYLNFYNCYSLQYI